jgi:hypothetical protein
MQTSNEKRVQFDATVRLLPSMRRIVYLLGAGFSAPLGLPVISNFYWKAKDLYDGDPIKFNHFAKSFNLMESFHRVKMFMKADLENIEEILSILEMKDMLSSEPNRESFSKFISDVIIAYTPAIQPPVPSPQFSNLFGPEHLSASYCIFVSQLFGICKGRFNEQPRALERGKTSADYSVISLNYDCVLEAACEYINRHYHLDPPLLFLDPTSDKAAAASSQGVMLAKLHGSVRTEIVPPTWNKKIHEKILPAWQAAFRLVAEANEIRFIGYSLPETDSYFRYFLKAAISQSFNLQRVDVLCSGNVHNRYQELFEANRLQFNTGKTEHYLTNLVSNIDQQYRESEEIRPNTIEQVHQQIFPSRT